MAENLAFLCQLLNTAISINITISKYLYANSKARRKMKTAKYERVKSVLMEWFWQNGLSVTI
jgi:hypothetical protein